MGTARARPGHPGRRGLRELRQPGGGLRAGAAALRADNQHGQVVRSDPVPAGHRCRRRRGAGRARCAALAGPAGLNVMFQWIDNRVGALIGSRPSGKVAAPARADEIA